MEWFRGNLRELPFWQEDVYICPLTFLDRFGGEIIPKVPWNWLILNCQAWVKPFQMSLIFDNAINFHEQEGRSRELSSKHKQTITQTRLDRTKKNWDERWIQDASWLPLFRLGCIPARPRSCGISVSFYQVTLCQCSTILPMIIFRMTYRYGQIIMFWLWCLLQMW